MKKLFEIELLKLRYSKSTKVVFIIYAAFTLLGLLAFQGALTEADNSPLTDAGEYTGNFVALPNNRVRATNPALWRVGEGAPDFMPSQWTHSAEQHESYIDPNITFDNLYNQEDNK